MTPSGPTRREFGTLVALGCAGLAGCLGDDGGDDGTGTDGTYDVDDQPDDAAARFVRPDDGASVESPVQVEGEAQGVEIVAAGSPVAGEAHLHVLVDRECFEEGEVIPGPGPSAEEEGIYHWGDGRTQGEIALDPGEYDLCLGLGDGAHRAFGEGDEISITVVDG